MPVSLTVSGESVIIANLDHFFSGDGLGSHTITDADPLCLPPAKAVDDLLVCLLPIDEDDAPNEGPLDCLEPE